MKKVRLIVNADDLGASHEANDAIFAAMTAGRVTSATLMANGPAFDEAVAGLRAFPQCSFGVHLNISAFHLLTCDEAFFKAGMTDRDGRFIFYKRTGVPVTPALRAAVARELAAQIEKVLAAGVAVSHLDSHHHMHVKPWMIPIVTSLMDRFDIRRVRTRKSLADCCCDRGYLYRLWRQARRLPRDWRYRRHGGAPDHFDNFGSGVAFLQTHEVKHDGVIFEFMAHPGNPHFVEENKILETDYFEKFVSDVTLTGFRAVSQEPRS